MKPGRWWRAQNSCVDNAKLIKLSNKEHRNWFNLNCVANEYGGVLPDFDTISVKLRMTKRRAYAAVAELVAKNLFDQREDGSFVPHDWNQWQYQTDKTDQTNAERQRNFRRRQREEIATLRALRNGVTTVMAKRPDTDKKITTTSLSVERGLAKGNLSLSEEALAGISGRKQ